MRTVYLSVDGNAVPEEIAHSSIYLPRRSWPAAEQLKTYPFWLSQAVDIANIVLFLASDESRMITGAAITADGAVY